MIKRVGLLRHATTHNRVGELITFKKAEPFFRATSLSSPQGEEFKQPDFILH
jgi:hypothetical protein